MRLYQSMCLYNPRWIWDKDRQIVTKWQIWSHYESLLLCLHHFGFMPWKSSPSALWGLTSLGEDRRPPWNLGQALGCKWNETLHIFWFFDMEGVASLSARVQVIYPTPNLWFSRWKLKWLLVFATCLLQTHKNFLYPPLSVLPWANYDKLSPEIKSSPKAFLPVWQSMHENMLQEGWEISEKREYCLNPTLGDAPFQQITAEREGDHLFAPKLQRL